MKVKPLYGRVLVKRIEAEEKVKGGIIIPDTAKEKPQQGEVIAISAGRVMKDGSLQPHAVKVGDRVLFGKYSGMEVPPMGDEDDLLILKEDEDILGIIQ